jgi:hypothetical protein
MHVCGGVHTMIKWYEWGGVLYGVVGGRWVIVMWWVCWEYYNGDE